MLQNESVKNDMSGMDPQLIADYCRVIIIDKDNFARFKLFFT